MAKNTSTSDDEIDLIELIQIFLTHKAKFIILGIVGLGVLGFTFRIHFNLRFRHATALPGDIAA
jgi:hypothetical protein